MSLFNLSLRFLFIAFFICLLNQSEAQSDSNITISRHFPIAIELRGKLIDRTNGKPISGEVEITAPGIATCKIINDQETGIYSVKLKRNVKYHFKAYAKGYFTTHGEVTISDPSDKFIVRKDIFFSPIETGTPIVIPDILFVQSKPEFAEGTTKELDKLVQLMEDNPEIEIELSGHTDNQGDEEKNMQLSEQRAEAVKNYLISKGIKADRIKSRGYGSTKPLASNNSEETRQQNRRVEYKITKF